LHVQITKAQKGKSSHQCLFALLGSAHVKAARKMLVEIDTGVNFNNPLVQNKRSWMQSVSPTKLRSTLPVNTTKSYSQPYTLHFTPIKSA